MNPIGCAVCGRKDVRLYRNHGSLRDNEKIVCNAHLPNDCNLGWWVPCIFDYSDTSEQGSIWGYTSIRKADMVIWYSLPDARFGPYWSKIGSWEASKSTYETACSLGERGDAPRRHQEQKKKDLVSDTCRHGGLDDFARDDEGRIHCRTCETTTP